MFAHKKGSVYTIKIYELGSDNRYVDFSIVRWASFVSAFGEAQNAIYEIHTNPQLKIQHHIGGGYYIPCLQTSCVATSGKKLTSLFYIIVINTSLNIFNLIR